MKRLIAAAALAAALSVGAGQALAGNQSGPEQNTKGTGEAAFNGVTSITPIYGLVCDVSFFFCGTVPIGQTTVTTRTAETFSFAAKSGPHELTPLDPTDGPQGTMKLSLETQNTTTVTRDSVCSNPNFVVLTPCPVPSTTVGPTLMSTATAEVTCLWVVNNRAAIGGHVTRFEGTALPSRGLLFNVTDNTIAGLQPAPDQFSAAYLTDAPQECPAPSADHPITKGDIYVDQS